VTVSTVGLDADSTRLQEVVASWGLQVIVVTIVFLMVVKPLG
jgi:hypothetical protein